ncbi:uncharacterized protein LOC117291359 [Asterias rubens]|uniref:uncharacterized protein LOC117291359 n=1 Tax=Asterias rubens TaxID=7604 RepID=UPI001455A497|nr:uncharacterized protein LOC117291359 [Asterias rubens]
MTSLREALCLVTINAHTCSVGHEQSQDMTMKWVTVSPAEPCDCSMIMLGGVNIKPVQHVYRHVHSKQPFFDAEPDVIKRHFNCDKMSKSTDTNWVEILSFNQSDQEMYYNLDVLEDWNNLGVQQVNISVGSKHLIDPVLELSFDGRGSSNTSWFVHNRLLNSPWTDLDPNAEFKLNWERQGLTFPSSAELLGIHSVETRKELPVSGWLVFAQQDLESILQGVRLSQPIVAFGKGGRVDWIDRDVLSHGTEAVQSSTSSPGFGQFGVDLKSNTRMSTDFEYEPWWTVDMGKSYQIERLAILPCEMAKTNVIGAQFRVSSSLDKGSGEPCGSPIVVVGVDVICEGEAYGRYLSLGIEGKQGILAFCGVSAFVKGQDPILAGQPTWQSSVLTHNASASVDGVLDFTCSQTNEEINPWWMVDLGDNLVVVKVVISPYPDLVEWIKMKGAQVFVSAESTRYSGAACGSPLRLEDVTSHAPFLIDCQRDILGRYVFIEGTTRLSMCEVEIFGKINGNVEVADTIRMQALIRSE